MPQRSTGDAQAKPLPKHRPRFSPRPTRRQYNTRGRLISERFLRPLTARERETLRRIETADRRWTAWETWPDLVRLTALAVESEKRSRATKRLLARIERLVGKYDGARCRPAPAAD